MSRSPSTRLRYLGGCALLILSVLPAARAAADVAPAGPPTSTTPAITLPPVEDRLQKLFAGQSAPASKDDLRALELRLRQVAAAVLPCTVGVQVGGGSGSGVIVSEDGFVLTAGHVSGKPGRKVTIILQDGRRVPGRTLGGNAGIDSGLIKIDGDERWPHAELGGSANLPVGMWCVATGHPAGFQPGRTSPIRVGRILANHPAGIRTDCMLVGGDSGGPLFDARARVIGIHSYIGESVNDNVCVPVDTYRDTWARLAAGEFWGGTDRPAASGDDPFIGVSGEADDGGLRLTEVVPGGPAARAGLQVDDVVRRFGASRIVSFEDLVKAVRGSKPGDSVTIDVARGTDTLTVEVIVGKRAE